MSAPSSGGDRFVPTADIRAALKGCEADLLDALGIRWREGGRHRRERRQKGRGDVIPPINMVTVQHPVLAARSWPTAWRSGCQSSSCARSV